MARCLGFLRLDVPRPVVPGGYAGMEFQVEVCTAGHAAPAYVWARSPDLYGSGFRDVRGRSQEYRVRRLYTWLLDHALTFTVAGGAARELRAHPVDPDRVDHLPYVPVPALDAARLGTSTERLLSGAVPLPALPPGPGGQPPAVLVVDGRFWGPFVPAARAGQGARPVPAPEGLAWLPAAGDPTEVLPDGETWFVRQDRYASLVRQLTHLARADAVARQRVVGTSRTRPGRLELRSVSELYEGWCLVQLVEMVEELGFALQPGPHARLVGRPAREGAVPQAPPGAEWLFRARNGHLLRLVYNGELPHTQLAARSRRQEFFAATTHHRPDFRLDLLVGNTCVRSLVFDAKRRRAGSLWDEAGYSGTMHQLHGYAFGIRHRDRPLEPVVRAAIALYSGHGADPLWLELEGGSIVLARLAPGLPNPRLLARLRRFVEEG